MNRPTIIAITAAVTMTAVFLAGCSPQERSGYSPIPQNTPAPWEITPIQAR